MPRATLKTKSWWNRRDHDNCMFLTLDYDIIRFPSWIVMISYNFIWFPRCVARSLKLSTDRNLEHCLIDPATQHSWSRVLIWVVMLLYLPFTWEICRPLQYYMDRTWTINPFPMKHDHNPTKMSLSNLFARNRQNFSPWCTCDFRRIPPIVHRRQKEPRFSFFITEILTPRFERASLNFPPQSPHHICSSDISI